MPGDFEGHDWEAVSPDKPYKFMKLTDEGDPGMTNPPWMPRLRFLNTLPGFECLDRDYMNSTNVESSSICF